VHAESIAGRLSASLESVKKRLGLGDFSLSRRVFASTTSAPATVER